MHDAPYHNEPDFEVDDGSGDVQRCAAMDEACPPPQERGHGGGAWPIGRARKPTPPQGCCLPHPTEPTRSSLAVTPPKPLDPVTGSCHAILSLDPVTGSCHWILRAGTTRRYFTRRSECLCVRCDAITSSCQHHAPRHSVPHRVPTIWTPRRISLTAVAYPSPTPHIPHPRRISLTAVASRPIRIPHCIPACLRC